MPRVRRRAKSLAIKTSGSTCPCVLVTTIMGWTMIENTRCDRLHVKRTVASAFTRSVVCAGHDGVERHAEGKRGLDDASGCDVLWRAARRSALSFQIMFRFGSIRVCIMVLRYVSASDI